MRALVLFSGSSYATLGASTARYAVLEQATLQRAIAWPTMYTVAELLSPQRPAIEGITLRRFTLDRPKLRCVVGDGDSPDTRLLLLSERLGTEGVQRAEPDSVPALTAGTIPCSRGESDYKRDHLLVSSGLT